MTVQKKANSLGKIIYALLFVLIIPVMLWYWAKFTEALIQYPAIESDLAGWIFTISGGLLLLWGMLAILKYGKGLPVNYQPPKEFVQKGPYRFIRNPIYWGFGILMVGVFILIRSASGLWLVTPVTILSMTALVLGYESIDLKRRFPDKRLKTYFDFPENNEEKPILSKKLTVSLRIITMLLLSNFLVLHLAGSSEPIFHFEIDSHPLAGNYLLILSAILTLLIPFLLKRNSLLREWNLMGIISISMGLFIALIYPPVGVQYLPPESASTLKLFNYSLTVITVPVFLLLISFISFWKQSKILASIFALPVFILSITQLAVSRSSLNSLIISIFVFVLAANYFKIWLILRNESEKIANSWHEWVFGKIRIINHGFYVGFGSFLGLLIAGLLVGKEYAWAMLVFIVIVIIIAALWAQIIEGSEKLKRPFGYYGGLAGMIFASATVWLMGFDVWVIVGVCTIFLPWVQAIGRLRCFVNGCCHGGPTNNHKIGIRYYHHRSRVCGISGLKGEYLHPTQLYSILWLFVIGFIFFALWNDKTPPSFLLGLYLILSGIGRFVEEAFRGEIQTPIVKNLRLYQWTAIITLILGIGFTMVPSKPILLTGNISWEIVVAAYIGGFFTFFAMGVDFPNSNARFSRLV